MGGLRAFLPILFAVTACTEPQVAPTQVVPTSAVVSVSAVEWEQLNPARGDKSPMAATLWGDRNGSAATGFLFGPVDGFQSPPHAHNVSYRGVVIRGRIHNDDPNAEKVWMGPGSFWTQPKGGVHITAAKGSDILAYIEIEEGPYRVLPVEQAFESGETPVNTNESEIPWNEKGGDSVSADGLEVALLWGDPRDAQASGSLVKLAAGSSWLMRNGGPSVRGVVIEGRPTHRASGDTTSKAMDPGSYFGSQGESLHHLVCDGEEPCVLYVRAEGELDVVRKDATTSSRSSQP